MPSLEHLLPFIVVTAGFAFIPGPGMFYMSVQTVARGPAAGLLSAAGFHLGAYVHICAAAFGVTVLLQAVPFLFDVLKLAGAVYLVWMGVRMAFAERFEAAGEQRRDPVSARRAFKDSLVVELLNPKTALFFLTFLPQFASPDAVAPVWAQVLVLGVFANVTFSATDMILILLSDRIAGWASASRRAARIGRRIGGGVFVALGAHLAFGGE